MKRDHVDKTRYGNLHWGGGEKHAVDQFSCHYFIALVTPDYVGETFSHEQCTRAVELQQRMYAIIQRGTDFHAFEKYPWKRKYIVDKTSDYADCLSDIMVREDMEAKK